MLTKSQTRDQYQYVLDVRDIIAHVEELRELGEDETNADTAELVTLLALLSDLAGKGGDAQWEGVWYPVTLIRDDYFTRYAQELCEENGYMPEGFPSYIEIDWDATARNIRMDYKSTEFHGVTYWFR